MGEFNWCELTCAIPLHIAGLSSHRGKVVVQVDPLDISFLEGDGPRVELVQDKTTIPYTLLVDSYGPTQRRVGFAFG